MKRTTAFVYSAAYIIIAVIASLYIGLFELPDSFFFNAIGHFLYTGYQQPILPFNTTIPLTLNAPVYGLIIAPFLWSSHPVATALIPFMQLSMVLVSSLIVALLSGSLFGRRWSLVGLAVFLLLPFTFVYAMTLMSEVPAMFLVSLYVYALFRINGKKRVHPGILVCISAVLTLTRFVFSFLFYASIAYWIWIAVSEHLRHEKRHVRMLPMASAILGIIGIVCIAGWMSFNLKYHHVFALYNQKGRALYYGAVSMAHLTPPDSSPVMKEMMKRVPSKADLFLPHNGTVLFFAREFREGTITESEIDAFFLAFAKKAITHNAFRYIRVIAAKFIGLPMAYPYHARMLGATGLADGDCPDCTAGTCRIIWSPQSCRPALDSPLILKLFGRFILFERALYPYGTLILFAVVCLGICVSVIRGGALRLLGLGYLFFHAIQLVGVLDSRYLIPLYPVYALLFVAGLKFLTGCLPERAPDK